MDDDLALLDMTNWAVLNVGDELVRRAAVEANNIFLYL